VKRLKEAKRRTEEAMGKRQVRRTKETEGRVNIGTILGCA